MVLKLYGNPISPPTATVATVLREKKVPFEFVLMEIAKADHKSPAYIEKQPFGQIPCIDDDGFVVYESRAIARYIDNKFPNKGPKLIPTGLKENALFEQAVSIQLSHFHPYASKAVIEKLAKPYRGLTPDIAVFDNSISELGKKLDVYEAILSKQKYIAGDEFTLADIFHLPFGARLADAGSQILSDPSRPNVARWWKDISGRDSWTAISKGVIESNA